MGSNPAQKQLGFFFENYWLLQVYVFAFSFMQMTTSIYCIYTPTTAIAYWVPDEVDDSPVQLSRSS